MSPYAVHAQVLNLTRAATESSTERYLKEHFGEDCQPRINLIDDENGRRAIVCFKHISKNKARKAISELNARHVAFADDNAVSSVPEIDLDCEGLLILKNTPEDPDFDVCFVHGLKGHALRTFSSSNEDHNKIKTWPRDLLPAVLDSNTTRGRYMSFGHDHDYLVGDKITEPLDETAQNLIDALIAVRGQACDKPIFFVCHSLGGLIVCKAVLLALHRSRAFQSDGRSLIKGIFFFGTPFEGTRTARIVALTAKLLKLDLFINTTTLAYLAVENKEIKHTVDEFGRVVSQFNIRLAIFYERLKLSKGPFKKLIVSRDSARGRFNDSVPKRGVKRNHKTLVKYTGHGDPIWKEPVSQVIKTVFRDAMASEGMIGHAMASERTTELLQPQTYRRQDTLPIGPGRALPPSNLTSLDKLVFEIPSETIRDAGFGFDRPSMPLETNYRSRIVGFWRQLDIEYGNMKTLNNNPSRETCDWMLEEARYTSWRDSNQSQILFVQAEAGYGKSWLAEFLVKELKGARNQSDRESSETLTDIATTTEVFHQDTGSRLVTWYFANAEETQTPQRILLHIVAQVAKKQPQKVLDAFIANLRDSAEGLTEVLLWKILRHVRRSMDGELFCVVDGLDQCIDAVRTRDKPHLVPKMVKSIETLCRISDYDITEMKMRTKVLIFSRAKQEIRDAIANRDIVFVIEEHHVRQPIKLMVQKEIEKFPPSTIALDWRLAIVEAIVARCIPIFLMAHRLLENIRFGGCDTSTKQEILDYIASNEFQALENVHKKYLSTAMVGTAMLDGIKLSKAIYFSETPLTKLELQEVLAIDLATGTFENFRQRLASNSLETLMNREFGSLFKTNNDNELEFYHFSVRTLLQELPDDSSQPLSVFSCKNEQEGHIFMMRLCLQYLIFVGNYFANRGDSIPIMDREWQFLYYAVSRWAYHAGLAKEALLKHLDVVQQWLISPGAYTFTIYTEQLSNHEGDPDDFEFEPVEPLEYFAVKGLDYLTAARLGRLRPRGIRALSLPFGLKTRAIKEYQRIINTKGMGGKTLLHHACRSGGLDLLLHLLENGADGSIEDDQGRSALLVAVIEEKVEVCAALILKKQACDTRNHIRKIGCLHMASYSNLPLITGLLLREGFDPNRRAFQGWTPLHCAAYVGAKTVFELLLARGANISAQRKDRLNCLHLAARNGHLDILNIILERANYADLANSTLQSGRTPIHFAAMHGNIDLFNRLDALGGASLPDKHGWLAIHYAAINGNEAIVRSLYRSPQLRALTSRKESILHLAARKGLKDLVEDLVNNHGFSPDEPCDELLTRSNAKKSNRRTLTPLYLACAGGHLDVAKFLASKGADLKTQSSTNVTLLHAAVSTPSLELTSWLLERDLDLTLKDTDGNGILHQAARGGHVAQVDALLKRETGFIPPLDEKNEYGMTPILLAAAGSKWDVVDRLLEANADCLIPNRFDLTFLHYLARADRPLPADLLKNKDNLEKGDEHGNTPLHEAADKGNIVAMKGLIAAGSEVNAVNKSNQTPIMLAAYARRTKAVLYLLELNVDLSPMDCFGRTVLDEIRDVEDYKTVLGDTASRVTSIPETERRAEAQRTIIKLMRELDSEIISKLGVCWDIGVCCKVLGLYDDAKFCFQTLFAVGQKYHEELFENWSCDICGDESDEGPWATCCTCLGTIICENCTDCVPDRRPSGCNLEHKYVSIGGMDTPFLLQSPEELEEQFEAWRLDMLVRFER